MEHLPALNLMLLTVSVVGVGLCTQKVVEGACDEICERQFGDFSIVLDVGGCDDCLLGLLGGPQDLETTSNWAYDPTYKWAKLYKAS